VGGGTCLHANQARRQSAEEADELASAELTADQNLSVLIDAMNLEHMLGEIEAYCRDMHWSGSLSGAEAITLSHRVLPGAGAVHLITYGTVLAVGSGRAYNKASPVISDPGTDGRERRALPLAKLRSGR
jgi:hypothetical protein